VVVPAVEARVVTTTDTDTTGVTIYTELLAAWQVSGEIALQMFLKLEPLISVKGGKPSNWSRKICRQEKPIRSMMEK